MENYNIGGWFNRVYYSWHDGLIWPTVYTIKQNKWKSKKRREENLKIIEKVNGSVQLCPKCDGYGFPNNLFYDCCIYCNGKGLVDWISKIR